MRSLPLLVLLAVGAAALLVGSGRGATGASPAAPEPPACLPIPGTQACIEAHEFTNRRFVAFLERNGPDCGGQPCLDTEDPGAVVRRQDGRWTVAEGRLDHPASLVTWYGAKAACAATGGRLCTPDEWTAACRGPQDQPLPYGTVFDRTACNGQDAGHRTTVPVASLPRCAGGLEGLRDMSGNVWEWTAACGPVGCEARGGSFRSYVNYLQCVYVDRFPPALGEQVVGFRCCRDR